MPITWGRGWQKSIASKALTAGMDCSRSPVSRSLLALGSMSLKLCLNETSTSARFSEEPGAGVPHAGICEGGAR